ncbi:MAG: hypothetical protein NTX49_09115 [Chlamydiae bacterium]|nr:hypothetical protein [Chlamydiota bacterium]
MASALPPPLNPLDSFTRTCDAILRDRDSASPRGVDIPLLRARTKEAYFRAKADVQAGMESESSRTASEDDIVRIISKGSEQLALLDNIVGRTMDILKQPRIPSAGAAAGVARSAATASSDPLLDDVESDFTLIQGSPSTAAFEALDACNAQAHEAVDSAMQQELAENDSPTMEAQILQKAEARHQKIQELYEETNSALLLMLDAPEPHAPVARSAATASPPPLVRRPDVVVRGGANELRQVEAKRGADITDLSGDCADCSGKSDDKKRDLLPSLVGRYKALLRQCSGVEQTYTVQSQLTDLMRIRERLQKDIRRVGMDLSLDAAASESPLASASAIPSAGGPSAAAAARGPSSPEFDLRHRAEPLIGVYSQILRLDRAFEERDIESLNRFSRDIAQLLAEISETSSARVLSSLTEQLQDMQGHIKLIIEELTVTVDTARRHRDPAGPSLGGASSASAGAAARADSAAPTGGAEFHRRYQEILKVEETCGYCDGTNIFAYSEVVSALSEIKGLIEEMRSKGGALSQEIGVLERLQNKMVSSIERHHRNSGIPPTLQLKIKKGERDYREGVAGYKVVNNPLFPR